MPVLPSVRSKTDNSFCPFRPTTSNGALMDCPWACATLQRPNDPTAITMAVLKQITAARACFVFRAAWRKVLISVRASSSERSTASSRSAISLIVRGSIFAPPTYGSRGCLLRSKTDFDRSKPRESSPISAPDFPTTRDLWTETGWVDGEFDALSKPEPGCDREVAVEPGEPDFDRHPTSIDSATNTSVAALILRSCDSRSLRRLASPQASGGLRRPPPRSGFQSGGRTEPDRRPIPAGIRGEPRPWPWWIGQWMRPPGGHRPLRHA